MKFLNKKIRKLINECLLINSKFHVAQRKVGLTVSWKSQMWVDGVMDDLLNPYTLNWLSSGTGQGFIDNLKKCIENAAEKGQSNLRIDFTSLGINKIRWGINEAFKASGEDKPIGAIPFKASLVSDIMIYLGFKVKILATSKTDNQVDISW